MVDNPGGVTGAAPDWLPVTSPPSRTTRAGQPPDWLPAQQPPSAMAAALPAVPDWLPAHGSVAPRPAGPPSLPLEEAAAPAPRPPDTGDLRAWLREEPPAPPPAPEPEPAAPPPAPEPEPPAEQVETPDWMAGLDVPPPPAPTMPGGGVTGWLRALDTEQPPAPPPAPAESAPAGEMPAEPQAELPDFLHDLASPAPAVSEPSEPSAELPDFLKELETPDWLTGLDVPPASPAEPKDELADLFAGMETPGTAAEPEAGLPDFLKDLEAPGPAAPEAAEPSADLPDFLVPPERPVRKPSTSSLTPPPDWLDMLGKTPPAAPAEPEAVEAESVEPEPAPVEPAPVAPVTPAAADALDWLAGQFETPAPSVEAPAAPSPAETEPAAPVAADVPDWLAELGEAPAQPAEPPTAPPPPTPEPAAPVGEDTPDWLAELSGAAPSIPSAEPAAPVAGSLDWLESLDFEDAIKDLPSISPATGEDLLGLTGGLEAPSLEEEALPGEEGEVVVGDLPAWMQSLRQQQTGETPVVPAAPVEVVPDLADQIGDLRFEAILGGEQPATAPEKVGALKELAGVIRPEVIFEGETLHVEGLVDEIIVTKDQARRIEKLNNLLFGETTGVTVVERGPGLPVVRWLVALLLLIAVALPAALGLRVLPSPVSRPGPVLEAREEVASLPPQARVLIAFEYEPDAAGEMQPLAVSLLDHLAELENPTVYAVTTRATGPAMIESAFAASDAADGRLNMGYVAGGPNGIRNLAGGSLAAIPSPLSFDYRGQPTNLQATNLHDADLDLIIVLAARWEYLQPWIEQAGTILDVPLLAGMSAAATPMAYPYVDSGQLVAVLSGVNDAATYRLLGGASLTRDLAIIWNGQALGGLVGAVVIVLGGILFGLGSRRSRQEGE